MITRTRFREIDNEIKSLIRKTLDEIRLNNFENYILYIADGDYNDDFATHPKFSPYIIDNRIDLYKDDTRINFLTRFMTTFYSFPPDVEEVTDDEYRIYMELMVYCHVWESKPYLRKLYRFALLANNEDYDWKVEVPEMSKHDFIRNNIRTKFTDSSNDLANIIRKGFHTSLRNAFAHSEFHILENIIHLDTYKGQSWDIQEISFDDWSERFCYSILLCYYLLKESYNDRKNIIALTGTDRFKIKYPSKDETSLREVNILYHTEQNGFSFERLSV
ncbi:hypothetical protein PGH12_06850 [Chryseobacterium wangxinyae]|uniref:hypothetical protein n=1 Tax=Chryseobacterium sp. CY350 TaxID=2997336 RepID=UPI002270ABB5|nr:hypothetical protein [Chryseobacterium sp. CY350]MCY0976869.1 hypothetical protein [Chryseobacterium sp. CY350]WBZ96868.1 hypothetical protein PGH12_06850 [Chryseobacterium sp. CY350]